jgi:hypothetical protein
MQAADVKTGVEEDNKSENFLVAVTFLFTKFSIGRAGRSAQPNAEVFAFQPW